MRSLTNCMRLLVLTLAAVPLLAGCGRGGQEAAKAAAGRAKPLLGNGVRKGAKKAAEEVGQQVVQNAWEQALEQGRQGPPPANPVRRERFPYPISDVRPLAGTRPVLDSA